MSLKEINNDIQEIKDMIDILVKEGEELCIMEVDNYDEISRQALHEKRQLLKSLKATLKKNINNLRAFKI
jgi:c-di-AMP phosphodiesterase-like protein